MAARDRELATYQREKQNLLQHEGQFVVIQGDLVAGVWKKYEDALVAAYSKFGLQPFLLKQIEAVERPLFISRMFAPARQRS